MESLSPGTRRRDKNQKRSLYMDAGVAGYWMVDPERHATTGVRQGREDLVARDTLTWSPPIA